MEEKYSADFPPLKNDLVLRAARGQPVERVPVWIMRQAGRYLPEFREVMKRHDFFTICQTPELACEVTLQPIRRFDLDAAIIFSDILVIPQALGMTVEIHPREGPVLPNPVVTPEDLDKLETTVNVQEKLGYVFDAITLTRRKLEGKVPLIGFSGAPWTLMGYMIEGCGSKTMSKAKKWLYIHPEASRKLLSIICDVVVDYLIGQVKAGAQLLQVFESSAEFLGPELFQDFALPFIKSISERVKAAIKLHNLPDVPLTIFAKGAHYAIRELSESNYDVIGLDWTIDPSIAKAQTKESSVALQGNFDPCGLYAHPDVIAEKVSSMISKFGKTGYIANLGHGIYPDMNPDHVQAFITAVHAH